MAANRGALIRAPRHRHRRDHKRHRAEATSLMVDIPRNGVVAYGVKEKHFDQGRKQMRLEVTKENEEAARRISPASGV
jgi:hypothetical protein